MKKSLSFLLFLLFSFTLFADVPSTPPVAEEIKHVAHYFPFLLGGVPVIGLIIFFAVMRRRKRNK